MQSTFASLSADPPVTLHMQLLEALAQESTSDAPSIGKTIRPHSHRRYATTAAAFLLLVSGLAVGAHLLPATPQEDTPILNNTVLSDPGVQARVIESTPENSPNSATPNPNAGEESTAGQVAPQPAQTPPPVSDHAAPSSAAPPSDPQPPSPTEGPDITQHDTGTASGLMSALLTQEEAAAKLLAQLTEAGDAAPQLSFLRLSEDGSAYLFLYTSTQTTDLFYTVSLLDGTICLTEN